MASPLVGWQNGDTSRGTFSIITTCATTIFACTWTIQHLNVPAAHDGELRRHVRVCKWMVITILLPELILAHAILEFAMALGCMREMEKKVAVSLDERESKIQVKYPSWMTRLWSFPAIWRRARARLLPRLRPDGLRDVEEQRRPRSTTSQTSEQGSPASQISEQREGSMSPRQTSEQGRPSSMAGETPDKLTWTLTHAYFANMGGFVYNPDWDGVRHQFKPAARPMTGIRLAAHLDFLRCPRITEAEIKDKSKTDGLGKVFSVFQISHLMLSLIVRRAQGLPISQLEVLTLAFAVCGVATYAAYWYKPKDIIVPVQLGSLNELVVGPDRDLRNRAKDDFETFRSFDSFWRVLVNDPGGTKDGLHRVPNDNIPANSDGFTHGATLLLAFVSALFSSLHAIAWSFDFPTAAEATIWHVCTILTILLPPLGLLGIPLSQATWRRGNDARDFLDASERVLRELAWLLENHWQKKEVEMARRKLEGLYHSSLGLDTPSTRQLYRDLLPAEIRKQMLDFVDKKGPFQNRAELELPRNYAPHLRQLFLLADGQGPKKMVEQVARTNVFPRGSLPTAFNSWFLYIAMGSYCVARLVLVAVAISSLRAMPQAVYNATWAEYIPAM
ncbi:uncharacterized protein B0T15DRAFT_497165 [Chaetomium strumarium]|uniref:Uncharacterized protein n=1 Tax=Chaetomium strumarium TaxID=1170767 RepID=A0AAJ0GMI9_9PEZI|nr:hypothetical protein B0T15DRAFT_497165 [Chaetomium strumarium]